MQRVPMGAWGSWYVGAINLSYNIWKVCNVKEILLDAYDIGVGFWGNV